MHRPVRPPARPEPRFHREEFTLTGARGRYSLSEMALRRPVLRSPVMAATLLAGSMLVFWALFLARNAGDLAAQYAWTDFIRRHPTSIYNLSWYGGMHTATYSVLSPYLMSWLGVRTTGVLAGTVSAALAALLLERSPLSRPLLPALWTAFALWSDVASGRVTFALGTTLGLAATALLFPAGPRRAGRTAIVALLSTLATLCSPVAGLFLGVIAAALFLTGRRREGCVLVAGPILVVVATALLFPFSGVQPFDWYVAVPLAIATAVLVPLVPREWRVVRYGAAVYAVGVILAWLVPSPIGSNVERLALLFGATVPLAVALDRIDAASVAGVAGTFRNAVAAAAASLRRGRGLAIGLAFLALGAWQVVAPIGDLMSTVPTPPTPLRAGPVIDELHRVGADRGRIEVVPLRSHWESSAIAPYVDLARGWNRQADVARNPLFYTDTPLTPEAYHQWLQRWAVGYVLLPPDQPDDAAVEEARIVANGNSWLKPVWQGDQWRLYQVTDAIPLVDPPATVTQANPAIMTVQVTEPGRVLVRVPWSPWLSIEGAKDGAGGCLADADGWTALYAPTPGSYRLTGRYSFPRAPLPAQLSSPLYPAPRRPFKPTLTPPPPGSAAGSARQPRPRPAAAPPRPQG